MAGPEHNKGVRKGVKPRPIAWGQGSYAIERHFGGGPVTRPAEVLRGRGRKTTRPQELLSELGLRRTGHWGTASVKFRAVETGTQGTGGWGSRNSGGRQQPKQKLGVSGTRNRVSLDRNCSELHWAKQPTGQVEQGSA